MPETLNGMIKAYNETPENFGSPSDKTVNEIIDHYYRLEPLPYSYNTIYVE